MKKLNTRYIAAGLIIVLALLLGVGLWAKHDADAKAAEYQDRKATLSTSYKKDASQLIASTLIKKDDYNLAPKQRAVCNQATTLKYKLTSISAPHPTVLNLGKMLSSRYRAAVNSSEASQTTTKQAITDLQKYYDICNYYVTDNEYAYQEKQLIDSAEYRNLLSFQPPSCNTAMGCISKENYARFAVLYDKRNKIIQDRNAKFKDMKCPFDTPPQKTVCDKFNNVRTVSQQSDEQYVAALRAGDTNKINELTDANSAYYQALKDANSYARSLIPTLPTDDALTSYFSVELAQIEKKLQATTL